MENFKTIYHFQQGIIYRPVMFEANCWQDSDKITIFGNITFAIKDLQDKDKSTVINWYNSNKGKIRIALAEKYESYLDENGNPIDENEFDNGEAN